VTVRATFRVAVMAVAAGAIAATTAHGQLDPTGYALGMASQSGSSPLLDGGTTLLGRGRFMVTSRGWPVEVDVAYEHILTRSPTGFGFGLTTPGADLDVGRPWGDWEIASTERGSWRHRFDRLSARIERGAFELTVGRQAISWATTLFLTPADPFVPFDPSDPFREYRTGVDAVRLRVSPGAFTEIDAVARWAESAVGTTTTVLVRGQTSLAGWSVGGWAGALHDEGAAALFGTGSIGATAVRGELSLREAGRVRGTLGLDRYLSPGGKDLFLVVEVQHDGFGAADAQDLLAVVTSEALARGEMQTLSAWSLATQAAYQLHPLVGIDALTLVSLTDGSLLVGPGASWSASSSAAVRAGLFAGIGEEGRLPTIGSEYGAVPLVGYLSLTWFF